MFGACGSAVAFLVLCAVYLRGERTVDVVLLPVGSDRVWVITSHRGRWLELQSFAGWTGAGGVRVGGARGGFGAGWGYGLGAWGGRCPEGGEGVMVGGGGNGSWPLFAPGGKPQAAARPALLRAAPWKSNSAADWARSVWS